MSILSISKPLKLIATVENPLRPRLVVKIPLHGLAQAGLKVFFRLPAEFISYFGGVDCVAHIVAGAIGDEGDQILEGFGVRKFEGSKGQKVSGVGGLGRAP